jgi:hypothetical protein
MVISDDAFLHPRARQPTESLTLEEMESALWRGLQKVILGLTAKDIGQRDFPAQATEGFFQSLLEGDELFDVLTQEYDPEARAALREEYDSHIKLKRANVPIELEQILESGAFWERATELGWGTRLCGTADGRIGLVPERTEVEDRVVVFGGCPIAFVLREDNGDDVKSVEEDGLLRRCKLVGRAYFCRKGDEVMAYDSLRAGDMILLG